MAIPTPRGGWSADEVADYFIQASRTAHKLPPVRVQGQQDQIARMAEIERRADRAVGLAVGPRRTAARPTLAKHDAALAEVIGGHFHLTTLKHLTVFTVTDNHTQPCRHCFNHQIGFRLIHLCKILKGLSK